MPFFEESIGLLGKLRRVFNLGNVQQLNEYELGSDKTKNELKRDRVAIVLIFTFGNIIKISSPQTQICGMEALEWLFEFYHRETDSVVRSVVVYTITNLLEVENKVLDDRLIPKRISQSDLSQIVKACARRYKKERLHLEGGEEQMNFNNRKYEIWIDDVRPDTDIEIIVKDWLRNGNPGQKELAISCLIKFTEIFELVERIEIEKILEDRRVKEELIDLLLDNQTDNRDLKTQLFDLVNDLKYQFKKNRIKRKSGENVDGVDIAFESINFTDKKIEILLDKLKDDSNFPGEMIAKIESLANLNS